MKISSFYKPIVRQFAKIRGKPKAAKSDISRTSSSSSTSSAKRMSSISSMTSEDSFSSHFAAVGQEAAQRGFSSALLKGLDNPLGVAKASGKAAIAAEKVRVDGLLANLGNAQRKHIKARAEYNLVSLRAHQINRQFGSGSTQARLVRDEKRVKTNNLADASAELYLAQIAF